MLRNYQIWVMGRRCCFGTGETTVPRAASLSTFLRALLLIPLMKVAVYHVHDVYRSDICAASYIHTYVHTVHAQRAPACSKIVREPMRRDTPATATRQKALLAQTASVPVI